MNWPRLIYYVRALPAKYLIRQLATRLWFTAIGRRKDEKYSLIYHPPTASKLGTCTLELQIEAGSTGPDARLAAYLVERYCSHHFDLLGTGWVDSGYSLVADGLAGHCYQSNLRLPNNLADGAWLEQVVSAGHLDASKQLWEQVHRLNPGYQPIDWQRDRKSGFRWSAQHYHGDQLARSRDNPGADPIQPWELARLLHLPQLAVIATAHPEYRQKVIEEFQLEVLDFSATNPVGMGVNWACTMDVAIRTANIVLAYWILTANDKSGDITAELSATLAGIIQQHGHFIRTHLEHNAGNGGNHYLANLVGLLFAAQCLEPTPQVLEWEEHALTELITECQRQFYPDGGHYEGASCYHALCTEFLIYALALACNNRTGLTIPEELFSTAARAVHLASELHGPTGALLQFGDNDSGRLFRLVPQGSWLSAESARQSYENLDRYHGDGQYFDENMLDFSGVLNTCQSDTLEQQLLAQISKGRLFTALPSIGQYQDKPSPRLAQFDSAKLEFTSSREFTSPNSLNTNLELAAYPDFGLYIVKSDNLFLAVSAHTNRRQKLNLAHSHNDKLGVELYISGKAILTDPGSYIYTPLPEWRDSFRSVSAHNTIQVEGEEQNRFIDSFQSYPDAHCQLLELLPHTIALSLCYRGIRQLRYIHIGEHSVQIIDHCNRPFRQCWNELPFESVGYGKLRRRA